jgi:hypothetical protein
MVSQVDTRVEQWPIEKLIFYARNPRENDAAVDRMRASIREFGFKIPVLARGDGEVVHLRLKAARKLEINEIPVIRCDEWTEAQMKRIRSYADAEGMPFEDPPAGSCRNHSGRPLTIAEILRGG